MSTGVVTGRLPWNETLPGYGDYPVVKGQYKPASLASTYTLSVIDGKLRSELKQVNFDVDPHTLKRTRTTDTLPTLVAKEIESK
jgi:hypothetical protein